MYLYSSIFLKKYYIHITTKVNEEKDKIKLSKDGLLSVTLEAIFHKIN